MFFKISKILMILVSAWALTWSASSHASSSEFRNRGLKVENPLLFRAFQTQKVTPKWGVNIIDFVRYITNLASHAPRKVSDVLNNLRSECIPSRIAANGKLAKACEFLTAHAELMEVQSELQTLLADGTFIKHPDGPNELVFRSLNWSLDPFSENVTSHPGERSRAVKVMVQWMLKRKELASRIDSVGTYYVSLRSTRSASTLRTTIPAIKAYYSSPLLLGQVAHFLRNQKCETNELPACHEVNRLLTVWLIEQVQEVRERLHAIKDIFEVRLAQRRAKGYVAVELDLLGELYEQDQAFAENAEAVVERYIEFLDKSATALFDSGDDLSEAKLGLVVASEIFHVFRHVIPEQPPLATEIIHPTLAVLEARIAEEIINPIDNLLYYMDQFDRSVE